MKDEFYEDDQPLAEVLAAFERAEKHLTERVRREVAQQHKGEVIEGSGRPVKRRKLDSIHSVRLSAEDAVAVRELAVRLGASGVGDVLREGLRRLSEPVGHRCEHMTISHSSGFTGFTTPCCGALSPVYA